MMADKSTCLELYIVDQLSEAEVNGAPHPRVHPSSPHAPEDRSVVVRVVPGQPKKGVGRGKEGDAPFITFFVTKNC